MGNPDGIPRVGKVFSAVIDRVDRSGNGIIETKGGEINVGPVVDDAVGEHLDALKLPGGYAICKRKGLRADGYFAIIDKKFGFHLPLDTSHPRWGKTQSSLDHYRQKNEPDPKYQLRGYSNPNQQEQSPLSSGEVHEVAIDRISNSGNGIVEIDGQQINIGPINENAVGDKIEIEIVDGQFAICHDTFARGSSYYRKHPADVDIEYKSSETVDKGANQINNIKNEGKTPKDQYSIKLDENEDDHSQIDATNHENISTLRKKAEDAAVDTVEQKTNAQQTISQYSRSSHIRRYVLARADGTCEGCRNPAPFESKTGEPYLHAHHVHELGAGGSDKPETVIALCPNCHYRVHHGMDGEEYNQELITILEEREKS